MFASTVPKRSVAIARSFHLQALPASKSRARFSTRPAEIPLFIRVDRSIPPPIMTPNNEEPPQVVDIEELHRQAILSKQSTYIDPSTGFTVFTELAHLKRGKCCGNMCRHCPYGYSNVKGVPGQSANAKAVSGDRERTGILVKRILNGTYYDTEECCDENTCSTNQHQPLEAEVKVEESSNNEAPVSRGKGGYAGGTLTSKNVPYTRKGDTGTSQLFTGERRSKDDIVFEAMGTVDELCCVVGTVYAELTRHDASNQSDATHSKNTKHPVYGDLPEQLLDVMSRLFDVGAHIARPTPKQSHEANKPDNKLKSTYPSHHSDQLEQQIDRMTDQLPELTSFILPTGSPASSHLHLARTVCRRAERRMVPLVRDESIDPAALAYVNRLSDYLFTAARFVNYSEGKDEVQYRKEREGNEMGRERVVVKLKD